MNLDHSIDIKEIYFTFKPLLPYLNSDNYSFDGAFFEFRVNSGKGHRFYYEVFRKLSIYFHRQAGVSGSFSLSDAPAFFVFRKFLFYGLIGVNKSCAVSKKGTG